MTICPFVHFVVFVNISFAADYEEMDKWTIWTSIF